MLSAVGSYHLLGEEKLEYIPPEVPRNDMPGINLLLPDADDGAAGRVQAFRSRRQFGKQHDFEQGFLDEQATGGFQPHFV